MIDRFGGGTRRILRLCAEQELPTPVFSEASDGFLVRFEFKEPIGPQKIVQAPSLGKLFTPRQVEILRILSNHHDLAVRDIEDKLQNPPSRRTIGDDLASLKEKGVVENNGTGRGARWRIKNGAENGANN